MAKDGHSNRKVVASDNKVQDDVSKRDAHADGNQDHSGKGSVQQIVSPLSKNWSDEVDECAKGAGQSVDVRTQVSHQVLPQPQTNARTSANRNVALPERVALRGRWSQIRK